MSHTLVTDSGQIDLTRHAFIEASAGTGKTYTLESLVVRLLAEEAIAIENILMVTFTEKAASELKIRIREKLEQTLAGCRTGSGTARKITDALDGFDAAAIHTIHGFCHTVLKDFAFENRTLFHHDLMDDAPVYDALAREQMRKVWPATFGGDLPEILRMAGFGSLKERFVRFAVDLARRQFRPGVGDRIHPGRPDDAYAEIRSGLMTRVLALKRLVGTPPAFSAGFGRLNINARTRASLLEKAVIPLETALAAMDENHLPLAELKSVLEGLRGLRSAGRTGIRCLVPEKWTKPGPNPEACPHLEAIVADLERLSEAADRLIHFLTADTVNRLQGEAEQVKRQNGWISYNDMLDLVDQALHGDSAPALIRGLRKRYRVAFVDEFQDTDPVQWRIFKRLFLDSGGDASENRLILIGDPKQAIYSFRGADVFAYLEARRQMMRIAKTGGARLYSLAVNWRSAPQLVAAFNRLFRTETWFADPDESDPFRIGYRKAASPAETDLPQNMTADRSGRPSMTLVDLGEERWPGPAKAKLARFVAAEIRRLVTDGGIRLGLKGGDCRPLDFGDICVLVRSRSDAALLEPELADAGIPYAFYKKPGLFFSREAHYLGLVFHAVWDPGEMAAVKQALLTPFFDCVPGHINGIDALPTAHPLKQVFYRWHGLARKRRWGALFQSLLEDTGLLFRESVSPDWDRQFANYRQIFEHLEAVAYRRNLDFRQISALLDSYRSQTVEAADDADIHQIETEERKVQMMTMHVSKGLQFPVVFIAGGLTQPAGDVCHVFHDPDREGGFRKVIDLTRTLDPQRHLQERIDEDKRLFYVALTRAQFKVYVPFFPAAGQQAWWGPVCRFVSASLASAFPGENQLPMVGWLPVGRPQAGTGEEIPLRPTGPERRSVPLPDLPALPPVDDFRARRTPLESFSSLHTDRGRDAAAPPMPGFQVGPVRAKDDDEGPGGWAADTMAGEAGDEEIPGGAHVGSMFHDILETIDFKTVAHRPDRIFEVPEIAARITGAMDDYRVDRRWTPRVCRTIANALTTPIRAAGRPFTLGEIEAADRIHEVAFLYPVHLAAGADATVAGCAVDRGGGGFVRGFVDLVFRQGGRFFIADWKSNRIDSGYGPESLECCMTEAGYHLQYTIYTVAVLRWLKRAMGDRFDPAEHFGGVFYFFLRGMDGTGDNGVYFVPPHRLGPPTDLDAEVARRMAEAAR